MVPFDQQKEFEAIFIIAIKNFESSSQCEGLALTSFRSGKETQAMRTKQDLGTSKGFFSTISDEHPRRFNMGVVPGIPSSVAGF